MKKLVYTFSLLSALAVCANAAEIAHIAPELVDGCYQIRYAGELFGFADIVNGIPADDENEIAAVEAQPGVCGKLVNDIRIIQVAEPYADNNHVVKVDLSEPNPGISENKWTPMEDFAGTFDGQGHTISGLFYEGENAGFFASLTGNATVKRLNIADSYFASDVNAGGFAARAFGSDSITIDNCNFKGLVNAITNPSSSTISAGGIIGIIEAPTKLSLTACVNEGTILPLNTSSSAKSGGLIGVISDDVQGVNLTIQDNICYGFVGGSTQRGVVGYLPFDQKQIPNRKNNYCYGTGALCGGKNCEKTETLQVCKEKLKNKIVNDLNNANFTGLKFEYNADGHIIIAHITEWEDYDTKEIILQRLLIPQTVIADSVDFDRVFNGLSSTIMLPFDILATNITDESNEKFVEFSSMPTIDTKKWEANAETETNMIAANKPYLLKAPTGKIHFHGPITLKTNYERHYEDSQGTPKTGYQYEYEAQTTSNDWTLVGTYRTMLTTSVADKIVKDTISKYERISNLGKIYGFVGTKEVSDGGYDFTLGEFALAGHNVRTREMRAYLIYNDNTPAPAMAQARSLYKAAALSDPVEELPSSIPVKLISKPIIPANKFVDPTLKVTSVASIDTGKNDTDNKDNQQETTTAITSLQKSLLKANKQDRWQDAKGRRLNSRPTTHGTYFKNGIPVIVK